MRIISPLKIYVSGALRISQRFIIMIFSLVSLKCNMPNISIAVWFPIIFDYLQKVFLYFMW